MVEDKFGDMLEEARLKLFFRMSQSRRLRRQLARTLGYMKQGWPNIKDEFPPYNKPLNLGIKSMKRSGASYKDVLEYKQKSYGALNSK